MERTVSKAKKKRMRHNRVRARISGSPERPRVAVFRSNKHIYAQIIDDANAKTILSLGDDRLDAKKLKGKNKTEIAHSVGKEIAAEATKKGVKEIVFDRGGFKYHGRVKAVAEGMREGGLEF